MAASIQELDVHIQKLAEKLDISQRHARDIINEVKDAVSQWQKIADECVVSSNSCHKIAREITSNKFGSSG